MDNFSDLFKKENTGEVILCILFIIYLLMGYKTPDPISSLIDNIGGQIMVVMLALLLFSFSNPIVGILGLIVAFELIRRSSVSTGTYALNTYVPNELHKMNILHSLNNSKVFQNNSNGINASNQFPYTLEQEVVKKMVPVRNYQESIDTTTFSPILDNLYDAAPINYTGVN